MNPLTQFKKNRILPLLIALALLTLVSPGTARADAVTDWNLIASTAIVTTAGQPPPVSALSFAMVQGAVYDAVNAIDRGHQPYLVQPPSNPTDSKEAATATAAFRVKRKSARRITAHARDGQLRVQIANLVEDLHVRGGRGARGFADW